METLRDDMIPSDVKFLVIGGGVCACATVEGLIDGGVPEEAIMQVFSDAKVGGMWLHAYDYVCLHTGPQYFRIGKFPWPVPTKSLQPCRQEILDYFDAWAAGRKRVHRLANIRVERKPNTEAFVLDARGINQKPDSNWGCAPPSKEGPEKGSRIVGPRTLPESLAGVTVHIIGAGKTAIDVAGEAFQRSAGDVRMYAGRNRGFCSLAKIEQSSYFEQISLLYRAANYRELWSPALDSTKPCTITGIGVLNKEHESTLARCKVNLGGRVKLSDDEQELRQGGTRHPVGPKDIVVYAYGSYQGVDSKRVSLGDIMVMSQFWFSPGSGYFCGIMAAYGQKEALHRLKYVVPNEESAHYPLGPGVQPPFLQPYNDNVAILTSSVPKDKSVDNMRSAAQLRSDTLSLVWTSLCITLTAKYRSISCCRDEASGDTEVKSAIELATSEAH